MIFFLFLQFYIPSDCILMWKNVLLQKPWGLSLTLNPKLFCIKLTESHNIQLYNNNRFVFSHFVLMIQNAFTSLAAVQSVVFFSKAQEQWTE